MTIYVEDWPALTVGDYRREKAIYDVNVDDGYQGGAAHHDEKDRTWLLF
jgi:hypothetical protein